MERANHFYEGRLGLTPREVSPGGKFLYSCGSGAMIALFEKEGGTKAEQTALSFEVENIESEIQDL